MPLGSRRKDANGYWLVKVREGGRWDKEHVSVAQRQGRARACPESMCITSTACATTTALRTSPSSAPVTIPGLTDRFSRLVDGLIRDGHIIFDRDSGSIAVPEIFYSDESVTLWHGDCLDVLQNLPAGSIDAVVTDPHMASEFMGRRWDGDAGFSNHLSHRPRRARCHRASR